MIDLLKTLYNDLAVSGGINLYIDHFIRNIPRGFGMHIRERWYRKRFKKCGLNLHVLEGTYIVNPKNIECGNNFFIGINNYIQAGGGLKVGDNVMMGPYAKIWTQNHNYKEPNTPVWMQGYEYKEVIIGDDVWLGANTFIMPGTIIRNGCIIAANSVVGAKDYKEGLILAGNPARKIGERY